MEVLVLHGCVTVPLANLSRLSEDFQEGASGSARCHSPIVFKRTTSGHALALGKLM